MAHLTELKSFFPKLIAAGRMSQGYLFFGSGARGGEAAAFSLSLARYVETGDWESPSVLLDTRMLMGRDAGIDEARSAIRFLYEQPLRSSRKLLIIQDADALTLPAAQALLKTVEEPPAYAHIILIAKDPSGMLPALVSRLQRIYVVGTESKGSAEKETATKLLHAVSTKERSELLKTILEEDARLPDVVAALLDVLKKDEIKYARLIQSIIRRWSRMERYTTNRKLQLEAAFAEGL